MLGINKAPIVDGLESVLFRIAATANPKQIGRGECVGVIFQNPLLDVDGVTPNTGQVWIGNSTDMIWLLIPGQESPLIYAEDLKDIYVKLLFPFPSPNGEVATVSIDVAGTGYTVLDVLTLTSPGGTDATIQVDAVDGAGAITAISVLTGGTLFVAGTTYAATGGTGADAEITVDTVTDSVPSVCNLCCLMYKLRKGGKQ